MKRFLKILALFLAPVILLLGMFSLALVRSGELTAIQTLPTGFSAEPPVGPAMPVVATA